MSKSKLLIIPMAFLVVVMFSASILLAGTTGKISGVVKDKTTGGPVPGAAVSIEETTIGALTNADGEYVILNVPVGTYTLKAQLVGYGSIEVENIRVSIDLTTIYDFDLTPLTVETGEVVVVRAERPLIQQDQTATLTIVSKEEIQQLPTRGYQDVVGLSSGVVAFTENAGVRARGAREASNNPAMNIRGGRQSDVAYYVDGFSQQDPLTGISTTAINNNTIEEIQITRGGFNAEYGKVSAGIINVTTKEGAKNYSGNFEVVTDNFHGESYDYNAYAFDVSGPVTPDFTDVSFYLSGERRWQADRSPKATANGILPNNHLDGYTWQGKLRFDVNPQATLRFGLLGSIDKWQEYRHSYLFNQEHMPKYEDKNRSYYLKLTHSISKSMFYEVSANYFLTERTRGDGVAYENLFGYGRPEGNLRFEPMTLFREWDDPETDIDESYVYDDFLHRKSSYIGFRTDFTSQLDSYNEIKFGGEYQRHTLRYYNHVIPHKIFYEWEYNEDLTDSNLVIGPQAWTDVNNYGYDLKHQEEVDDGLNGAKHPYEISLYFQDKFEFEGLIVNAGLRYDYFNANTLRLINDLSPLNPNLDQVEGAQKLTEEDLEDAEANKQWSPRLGVAYPVSDRTHFRISYGKFFQRPELQYLYVNYDYLEYMAVQGPYYFPIGNPNLEPEQTTAYEIGITHRLGDNTRLDVTAYYKDIKNLTQVVNQATLDPSLADITWYRNQDFGTVRGIELGMKMRRSRNIAVDVAYTLAYASGTGSYATTQSNIAWTDEEIPLRVSPLDFDQRHKFTGIFDLRTTKGEGPKLGDFFPLENSGLNAIVNVASGTPYTESAIYNEVTLASLSPNPTSTVNARYGPWTVRVDLKLNRQFNLFDLNLDAYLWVLNVFDRENILDVFEGTGKPDETGWLATDDGKTFVADNSKPNEQGLNGYDAYQLAQNTPLNYDIPRLIRFGLRLSF